MTAFRTQRRKRMSIKAPFPGAPNQLHHAAKPTNTATLDFESKDRALAILGTAKNPISICDDEDEPVTIVTPTVTEEHHRPDIDTKDAPVTAVESNEGPVTPIEPAVTFSYFSKLPTELRWRVWEFVSRKQRVITFYGKDNGSWHNYQAWYSVRCHSIIPPILHAAQESRTVGLKIYRPSFASMLKRPVYFNKDVDILILRDYESIQYFAHNHCEVIGDLWDRSQSPKIDENIATQVSWLCYCGNPFGSTLMYLSRVKHIILFAEVGREILYPHRVRSLNDEWRKRQGLQCDLPEVYFWPGHKLQLLEEAVEVDARKLMETGPVQEFTY